MVRLSNSLRSARKTRQLVKDYVSTWEKLNSHTIAENHPLINKTESIDTIGYETRETKQIYGYIKKYFFDELHKALRTRVTG